LKLLKTFLILLFITGVSLSTYAQVLPDVSGKNSPVYYLDHVRLTKLPVFSVDQIDSIDVVQDHVYGKIYIKTKDPKALHFNTLSQIAKRQGLAQKHVIYMLDGQFLQDTTVVRIDSSYILRTVLIPSNNFKYLDRKTQFTILNILTKSKVNLEQDKIILVKGL
jgi:hypothetical protein